MTESCTRRFLWQIAKYSFCKKTEKNLDKSLDLLIVAVVIVTEYANIFLTFNRPFRITGFASFR